MSIDSLLHRIEGYLKKARAILPTGKQLPFIVKQVSWPEEIPAYAARKNYDQGKIADRDFPGYAMRNQEAETLSQEANIPMKLYLFDPEEEGQDDRPSLDGNLEFSEWETWPPPLPKDE